MSAVSPGLSFQTPKDQSHITSYDQQHPANLRSLQAFKSIIKSCYGPQGHLKMIQNQCRGHVTVTSSSQRLLSTLSLSKPILKMISTAVEGHLKVYSDGGLQAALLACSLIEGCWKTGLHPMMCNTVNDFFQDICKKVMMNICRMPINIASMDSLLSLTRSVLTSKPGCGLVKQDANLITSLVVQSFVSSIPSEYHGPTLTIPEIQIIGVEAEMPSKSRVIQGLLIDAPDIPAFYTKELEVPRMESGSHAGHIRVVLFNISLAGDSEEFTDVGYELGPGVSSEASTLQSMRDLVDELVKMKVGLVACQKVIHPTVKRYLRHKGVLALDRLSICHIGAVQQITRAKLLGSFSSAVPFSSFGYLSDINHHIMFGRSYLHLQNTSSSLCTLVLCNYTEQALEEMKHVCHVAHHTLGLAISDPTTVPGAGCLNLILAHHVREQVLHVDESIWRDIGCSKAQFDRLGETFASCLEAVSMATVHDGSHLVTDSTSHHSWIIPKEAMADPDWLWRLGRCHCGMKAANQLRASTWSIVGNLKCGAYKMEKRANKETGRTSCSRDLGPETLSCPTSHQVMSKRATMHDGTVDSKPSEHRGNEGKDLILDSFPVRFNSFCVAVDIANVVMRIGHTVEDVN